MRSFYISWDYQVVGSVKENSFNFIGINGYQGYSAGGFAPGLGPASAASQVIFFNRM
jgi:hypothetical protein